MLYASWPRAWSSHIRLEHLPGSGEKFTLSATNLFPHGYGLNSSPFELEENGDGGEFGYFVLEDSDAPAGGDKRGTEGKEKVRGLALLLDREAVRARERASGIGEVEEVADVWFEKVGE